MTNGTSCSDGNACTRTDTCQGGTCAGGNPVVCTALDQCHNAGVCSPASGTCSNPSKPNGSACDDGSACTRTDTCQAGGCVGGNLVVCTALDQCHNAGVCSPASGTCSNPSKPDGSACDDGDVCTAPDSCQAGSCIGGPPACNEPPIDSDEQATLTEDEMKSGRILPDFKLANASDPDGDDVDVQSLDAAALSAMIDGADVSADFSVTITGFVGTVRRQGVAAASFTVDPETGTETIASLDDALWDSLGSGDSVSVRIGYTVTDGSATDTSSETVRVLGVNDPPTDPNEALTYTEDEVIAGAVEPAGTLLAGAFDPEGDPLSIVSIDSVSIDSQPGDTSLTVAATGNPFVYQILEGSQAAGTWTFGADGSLSFVSNDDSFWSSLGSGDAVVLRATYRVSDPEGGVDVSQLTLTINGINSPPIDSDEQATLTEDEMKSGRILPDFKLANASDPDGDDMDVQSLDAATLSAMIDGADVSADFSVTITGFVGTVRHQGVAAASFTVDPETGTETIASLDDALWDSLGSGDSVSVRIGYTVTDGSATDTSSETVRVLGVNDPPTDPNEALTYTEDEVIAGAVEPAGTLLAGAFDPEGDPLSIVSIDSVSIDSQPGDTSLTVAATGNPFVYQILEGSQAVGTWTFGADGSLSFVSNDDSFWSSLGSGDAVVLRTTYRVSDPEGGVDASQVTLTINGTVTFIPDAANCLFPWSLFSFQSDAPDSLKAIATLDADGLARQFLKLQVNGSEIVYSLDFDQDGAVAPEGETALFHVYSGLLDRPVIIDVLIAQMLSSGDPLYDVSNIKPGSQGGGVFDPSDPINTYFFLDELSDGSESSGNLGPLYLIGTADANDPLSGNNDTDVLLGAGGNDGMHGNLCEDYVGGGPGSDVLAGASDGDVLDGGGGADVMDGGAGVDVLLGGPGADTLNGSGQKDVLFGGLDNDMDVLAGGTDADLYVLAVTTNASEQLVLLSGNDVIMGFQDTIDSLGFLDYSQSTIIANGDTNRDLTLDTMSAFTGHVTITTGNFSGNGLTDTRISFDGGGAVIFDGVNNVELLNDLFGANLIQVVSATGL